VVVYHEVVLLEELLVSVGLIDPTTDRLEQVNAAAILNLYFELEKSLD
jgi:hypothetical protein